MTTAQLGNSLKNTLTEEVDARLKSLVMEPLKERDERFHDRLSPMLFWDLHDSLFWPLVSKNRMKIKDRLASRLEEAL